jgi:hypothetical protein
MLLCIAYLAHTTVGALKPVHELTCKYITVERLVCTSTCLKRLRTRVCCSALCTELSTNACVFVMLLLLLLMLVLCCVATGASGRSAERPSSRAAAVCRGYS